MKLSATAKKVWNITTSILVGLVVLVAIALVGVRLVGITPYTILSGSMEPNYPTGSLIYVKEANTSELEAGEVITFMMDEDTIATHRIVNVVPDEEDPSTLRFETQGDANEHPDSTLVHWKNVIGTPVFCIPYLGYFVSYIQSPPGLYIGICAGAFILLLFFLPDLFGSDDEEKAEKQRKQAATA